jgi:hypothetical protein
MEHVRENQKLRRAGAVLQESANYVRIAAEGRCCKGSHTMGSTCDKDIRRYVDIGSLFGEELDHFGMAVLGCIEQRRGSILGLGIDLGTCCKRDSDALEIALPRRGQELFVTSHTTAAQSRAQNDDKKTAARSPHNPTLHDPQHKIPEIMVSVTLTSSGEWSDVAHLPQKLCVSGLSE